MLTLTPAYGRDYKSKRAVLEAFESDVDFMFHAYHTPRSVPGNRSDLVATGETSVKIRYDKLRKAVIVELG